MLPVDIWANNYIPEGAENAIPRKEILDAMAVDGLEISDRMFRKDLKKAVQNKQIMVCSTVHGGYYRPRNKEDIEINTREINSRIHMLIKDREAIRSMAAEQGII